MSAAGSIRLYQRFSNVDHSCQKIQEKTRELGLTSQLRSSWVQSGLLAGMESSSANRGNYCKGREQGAAAATEWSLWVEEATEGSVTGRRGVVATPKAECEATQAHARRARFDWLAGLCS